MTLQIEYFVGKERRTVTDERLAEAKDRMLNGEDDYVDRDLLADIVKCLIDGSVLVRPVIPKKD